jgi:hypothetical protein
VKFKKGKLALFAVDLADARADACRPHPPIKAFRIRIGFDLDRVKS